MDKLGIYAASVSHEAAAVHQREPFAFTPQQLEEALDLPLPAGVSGMVLVSTCNRTELWLSCTEALGHTAPALLCQLKGLDLTSHSPSIQMYQGQDAAHHLLQLACGLKSLVFGEDQILTQIKTAILRSRERGRADTLLEVLFRTAVTAAKEVKTQVTITRASSSVAGAAVDFVAHKLKQQGCTTPHCLVIGNGEMGRLTANSLLAKRFMVDMTIRRYKAGVVNIPPGCGSIGYEERYNYLSKYDAVFSATTSPHYTIKGLEAQAAMANGRPRIFFDMAMPRDMEPTLEAITAVPCYNIDSLQGGISTELVHRQRKAAGQILKRYVDEFDDWYNFREYIPKVKELSQLVSQDIQGRLRGTVSQLQLPQQEKQELQAQIAQSAAKAVSSMLFGIRDYLDDDHWNPCITALRRGVE